MKQRVVPLPGSQMQQFEKRESVVEKGASKQALTRLTRRGGAKVRKLPPEKHPSTPYAVFLARFFQVRNNRGVGRKKSSSLVRLEYINSANHLEVLLPLEPTNHFRFIRFLPSGV